MKVVINSLFHSPRLSYLTQWLEYRWTVLVEINTKYEKGDVVISYGSQDSSNNSLSIPSAGLLEHGNIVRQSHKSIEREGLNVLFAVDKSGYDLIFDFFSMAFYLLTRYEEYTCNSRDEHYRWKSDQSIAVKYKFIELPLIDLWLNKIEAFIESRFGVRFHSNSNFAVIPTIDIDLPYAYRYRQWKNFAALLRDLLNMNWVKIKGRLNYLSKGIDPFDRYDYLIENLSQNKNVIFFFLCRYQKPYDENHLVGKSLFSDLVERIVAKNKIGIHPSYSSGEHPELISEEVNSLTNYSNQKIELSRQHFLRLSLPDTYSNLIASGIKEDHSMMYPDQLGFRASTCHPFYWYDLQNETTTNLLIHSPCIMDVTLKDYYKLSPEEAIIEIDKLRSAILQVHGRFEFIWHNSSFSDIHGWTGWQKVFEYLLSD